MANEWMLQLKNQFGATYQFATANIVSGDLAATKPLMTKVVISPGVDGEVYRTREARRAPLVLECIYALTTSETFPIAESMKVALQGFVVEVILKGAGFTRTWKDGFVISMDVVRRTGQVIGYGEKSSSTKSIIWRATIGLPKDPTT